MIISTRCGNCQSSMDYAPGKLDGALRCGECETSMELTFSGSILQENVVDTCPHCGSQAFYVQRDFNQKLGVAIMVVFAVVGLIFVALDRPFYFYFSLALGALVDLVLYRLLPEITVCYKCKSAFRETAPNASHGPFDLHIADHYEGRSQG